MSERLKFWGLVVVCLVDGAVHYTIVGNPESGPIAWGMFWGAVVLRFAGARMEGT